ncbi:hypothetical protein [Tenacibaculum sp. 190524A05c]|uniref:hypothetical protein n=1 Tax=Tenacibaculum platacis TaxID=3137852 RepID=UPI0032B0FCBA
MCSQELDKLIPGNTKLNDYSGNPSTPSTWSFNDYSKQELVDLYTGMVNINLPIYEIKEKDLNVPISLNYRSDGIKVNDIAGNVGLGWKLVTGGTIEREIKGNPDETITRLNSHGNQVFSNLGRYMDLINSHPNQEQIPTGNLNVDNVMDYYVEMLKNDSITECFSSRGIHFGIDASNNNTSQEDLCKFFLLEMIKNVRLYNDGSIRVPDWNFFRDTQPDIFHYTLPNAKSGSFILDEVGNAKIISGEKDVKITPAIGPLKDDNGWTIKTSDGISFFFPSDEQYIEKTEMQALRNPYAIFFHGLSDNTLTKDEFLTNYPNGDNGVGATHRGIRTATSTWHIQTMKSARQNTEVTFEYNAQGDIDDYQIEESKIDFVFTKKKTYTQQYPNVDITQELPHNIQVIHQHPGNAGFLDIFAKEEVYYHPILIRIKSPKYVSKINFSSGSVEFVNKNTPRLDVANNYALDKIIVKDHFGKLVKQFKLDYDNFIEHPYINLNESSRLQLKRFYELSTDNTNTNGTYEFTYNNNVKLPNQHSTHQDFWGYFNGNKANSTSLIPSGNRNGKSFSGADRSSDETTTKAWILNKIKYPTGGSDSIVYELNTYKEKLYGIDRNAGGLRVAQTITHDGITSSNDIIKNYSYENTNGSTGAVVNELDSNWWRHYQSDTYYADGLTSNLYNTFFSHKYIKRSSNSLFPIIRTKGGIVGYGEVTVSQNGNGKTVYTFTNPESKPDEMGSKHKFPYKNQSATDGYHDNPHTSRDALRGISLSETIYDESSNKVSEIRNIYDDNSLNHGQIVQNNLVLSPEYGIHVSNGMPVMNTSIALNAFGAFTMASNILDFTEIKSYFPLLKKTITTTYNDQSPVTNISEHFYDGSNHLQRTRTQSIDSYGETLTTKVFYPLDKQSLSNLRAGESEALSKLIAQNRVNQPVQIESYRKGNLLATERNNFTIVGDLVLEKDVQLLKGITTSTNQFEDRIKFYKYDDFGNVLDFAKVNGARTLYIWGYHENQLVAKIENATYDEIQPYIKTIQDLSNLDNDNTQGYTGAEGALRNALDNFRNALPNAFITSYTYDWLVGITSITDPKGYITYYEYDNYNRLKSTHDHQGNILQENKYNYKN